jgi:hypothetical protein
VARVNLFRIFRSRRAALLWAGSVIWFAYDVASAYSPDQSTQAVPTDATGQVVNAADLAILANATGS